MKTQTEKAHAFQALHARTQAFVIPNPWDVGSARILEKLGYEALATTSAGYAFSAGKLDNTVDRNGMMGHLAQIAAASELPVSADLGNGFGDAPEIAAETIRLAAGAGVVGGSIEDATGDSGNPIYEIAFATERIRGAVASARGLGFPFTLTARAENYLHGRPDLKDTIKRLQAYQEAGADVLYAPGVANRDEIATIVRSLDWPVNVVMGLRGAAFSVQELSQLGVRRISVGSALCRAAYGEFLRAAKEMLERGTFTYAENTVSVKDISALLKV